MKCMEEKKKNKFDYVIVFMFVGIVAGVLLYCFKDGIHGNDFWWHIKAGEWIVEHKRIPVKDIFSWYGMQENISWTAHEWLSEVIFYEIYRWLGSAGMYLFSIVAAGIFIWLLFREVRPYCRKNLLISGLYFSLLAVLCSLFFYGRPHMFSFFLLFFELKILYEFMENPKSNKIYLIILIGCLWSNLHGGSANLSYLLCIACLICAGVQMQLGRIDSNRLEKKGFWKLFVVTVGTILSIFINPIGCKVFMYPYASFSDKLMLQVISEWQPPDAKDIGQLILYFLPIFLLCMGIVISKQKIRLLDVVMLVIFLYLFFRSARFIMLWYIGAVFFAFPYVPECSVSEIKKLWEKVVVIFASLGLLGLLFYDVYQIKDTIQKGTAISKVVSDEMISYIKEDAPERIFNDYNVGESLIYAGVKVFFDARADLYAQKHIMEDGISLLMLEQANKTADTSYVDVEVLMDTYDFDGIITLKVRPLYTYLLSHPEYYEKVYEDTVSGNFKRVCNS